MRIPAGTAMRDEVEKEEVEKEEVEKEEVGNKREVGGQSTEDLG